MVAIGNTDWLKLRMSFWEVHFNPRVFLEEKDGTHTVLRRGIIARYSKAKDVPRHRDTLQGLHSKGERKCRCCFGMKLTNRCKNHTWNKLHRCSHSEEHPQTCNAAAKTTHNLKSDWLPLNTFSQVPGTCQGLLLHF